MDGKTAGCWRWRSALGACVLSVSAVWGCVKTPGTVGPWAALVGEFFLSIQDIWGKGNLTGSTVRIFLLWLANI